MQQYSVLEMRQFGCHKRITGVGYALLAALRRVQLPSAAAAVLRIVPDERLAEPLLRSRCEDGFVGADSHRFDAEAVGEIARTVIARDSRRDAQTRAYATAALGAFPRELAEPALRSFLRRFMLFPVHAREVRRAARQILSRYPKHPAAAAREGGPR